MLLRIIRDPVTRMKFIIIFGGILLFIVVFLGAAVKVTGDPEFCVKCHEMKPQYSTWQVSSHSRIDCVDCHIPPGVDNLFKVKFQSLTKVYLHFSEGYFLPIQVAENITSERCFQCHSMQRQFNASGDIKIPHDKHMKKEVNCLECHAGIVHGKIAHRLETIDGDFSRWNPIMARAQIIPENKMVNMTQCLNCHALQKVEAKCEDCHSQIHFPESHKEKSWVQGHSVGAKKDLTSCDKCHSYTNTFALEDIMKSPDPLTKPASKVVGLTSTKVIDYARTNTLCFDCHRKKPASHERSWGLKHPIKASKDSSGCLVCHDYSKKKVLNPPLSLEQNAPKNNKQNNSNPATTTCSQCHVKQHYGFNRDVHPVLVPLGTKYNQSCINCHNVGYCGRCHSVRPN